jgi:hypothetical protein
VNRVPNASRWTVVLLWAGVLVACGAAPKAAVAPAAIPAPPASEHPPPPAEPHAALRALDPQTLMALEQAGFSFGKIIGATGETGADLMRSPRYASLVAILGDDLAENNKREGVGPDAPNRSFKAEWFRSPHTHFELVGAINRIDRRSVDDGLGDARWACGEERLVYRLALVPDGRPGTRLPMTVNVIFPEPLPAGAQDCRAVAEKWLALPAGGSARVGAIASLFRSLPPPARLETNLQNLHGPSYRQDEDDHAEYVLRSFDLSPDAATPRLLLNTPRPDLGPGERADLRQWIVDHFASVDDGTAVLPDRFLAKRATSFSPRGLARPNNRPFKALFGADGAARKAFASLPFGAAKLVHSPAALVRRLDQMTCPGCHQTEAIAGFHLLGEERDPQAVFNALDVGRSPHFDGELAWREALVTAWAGGSTFATPRPFADRPADGSYGAHCGLGDAGFADWTCRSGLRCRDVTHDEVGMCVPSDGNHPGDPCQDAVVGPSVGADGNRILAKAAESCAPTPGADEKGGMCAPNAYGFMGGVCSEACAVPGEIDGPYVCVGIPATEYEADCFPTTQPIEECMKTHLVSRRMRSCDASNPCRDDFACAKIRASSGSSGTVGACVPPYFLFQARVDGPALDR